MFANLNLTSLILSLPVIFLALSVHEASHGFVAYKLGDPTAKNLGRLTLNPVKHIDVFGFICMLLFRFGWAKPVPVSTRYFKKPRRDMAITAAAGPISNVFLSIVFAALLRLDLFVIERFFAEDIYPAVERINGYVADVSMGFNMMCVLTYILYLGVLLNISLAVFNMIPIPPFDGSRLAYLFIPQKWYYKIVQYERYIMIGILLLLWFTPILGNLVSGATSGLSQLILWIFGVAKTSTPNTILNVSLVYLESFLF